MSSDLLDRLSNDTTRFAAVEAHRVDVGTATLDPLLIWPLGVRVPTPVVLLLQRRADSLGLDLASSLGVVVVLLECDAGEPVAGWEQIVSWLRQNQRRLRCDPRHTAVVSAGLHRQPVASDVRSTVVQVAEGSDVEAVRAQLGAWLDRLKDTDAEPRTGDVGR